MSIRNSGPYPRLRCEYNIMVNSTIIIFSSHDTFSQVISNSFQDGFTSSSMVHRMNTKPYIEDSCSGIFDYSMATYNYTVMWSLLPNDCPNRFIVPSYSVTFEHARGFGELDLQSTLVSLIQVDWML